MIKKIRIIVGLISICIIVYVIILVAVRSIIAGKSNKDSLKNSEMLYDQEFSKQDSLVFKNSALSRIKNEFIFKSNYRNNVICHNFNDQARILYTRIDLKNDIPMDKFIWFREKTTSETLMHTYDVFDSSKYNLRVLGESPKKLVDTIIFSLRGTPEKLQKAVFSKNFVGYYIPVSSFSLRYGEKCPTDIYFGTENSFSDKRSTYPLMISFYKKGKHLYVVLFIPKEDKMIYDVSLLKELLKEN